MMKKITPDIPSEVLFEKKLVMPLHRNEISYQIFNLSVSFKL